MLFSGVVTGKTVSELYNRLEEIQDELEPDKSVIVDDVSKVDVFKAHYKVVQKLR